MATEWARLKEPFHADAIEWRIGRSGIKGGRVWATCLAYVTARAIQDRLDDVFGIGGWKNEYTAGPSGGVLCRIWFRDDSGEWVWREDGGGEMEASRGLSDSDANKGTLSSALKRAGSALGIGRYLYNLDEGFANVHEGGRFRGEAKGDGNERVRFKWDPPALPAWALPPSNPNAVAHTEVLEAIRSFGAKCEEEAEIHIDGGTRNLKAYVRENWPTLKENYARARAVLAAIESA